MIRAALFWALATPAGAFELTFPAACDLGDTCYIQQYFDHDPGPAAQDFACGPLSYQDHDGTDIALPSLAAMQAGVNVLAAAAGTVKAVRDGMPDARALGAADPAIQNRECGNGVLVDHGSGWETQYCHMKQGSVAVTVGDDVTNGFVLGQIGMSGLAQFPHLHLTVRRNGRALDPFAQTASCGQTGPGLWVSGIPYTAGGLLAVGLTDGAPTYDTIKAGLPSPDLPDTAPALVVWAYVFGGRAGDALLMEITGPEGRVIVERVALERIQAQLFRAVGRRLGDGHWPSGRYKGTVRLLRAGTAIDTQSIEIAVN